ncbi:MAG TPA: adenylate/guanylate cyclase domain-containing protein [Methylomirabilota bacterium]|nr:adenylate/guanylate cyclase domain-containing protein [Methylomirabilota bacterium]
MVEDRSEVPLLIAFADLTRFFVQSQRVSDLDLADTLDAFYECVAVPVDKSGGRVVKFIGDAALIVFSEDAVDRGVEALLQVKDAVDDLMERRRWDCRLTVKAHFGTTVAGPFGAAGAKRFDVIGKAVNTAATLEGSGVTLSVAAFRKLGPELRRRFRKHTPPVTYIRHEDPRR